MTPDHAVETAESNISWRGIAAAIATISAVGAAIGLSIPLLSVLLEARGRATAVTESALVELGNLVEDRNALIHYSLMDEATRLIFDRAAPTDPSGMLVVWSAHETPTRVEEGRILRLMKAEAAAMAVKRSDDVFALWNEAEAEFRRAQAAAATTSVAP